MKIFPLSSPSRFLSIPNSSSISKIDPGYFFHWFLSVCSCWFEEMNKIYCSRLPNILYTFLLISFINYPLSENRVLFYTVLYCRPVKYHNWRHALNVSQTMFTMLKTGRSCYRYTGLFDNATGFWKFFAGLLT